MSEDDFAMRLAVKKQQRSLLGRGIRYNPIQFPLPPEEDEPKKKHDKKRRRR